MKSFYLCFINPLSSHMHHSSTLLVHLTGIFYWIWLRVDGNSAILLPNKPNTPFLLKNGKLYHRQDYKETCPTGSYLKQIGDENCFDTQYIHFE